MTKLRGFLEPRIEPGYRPVEYRVKDFAPAERDMTEHEVRGQSARCMECGVPFCHAHGCPLSNTIPECNELVYQGRWGDALDLLLATNPFPEFTGRVCPAPCEASCVAGLHGEPVAIRQMEKAIMDHAYAHGLLGRPPPFRRSERIAIIGAGPAGLATAELLNREGFRVTVFDEAEKPGGILRYGIPNFKLDKGLVDRRIALMKQQGIIFENGVRVGRDISHHFLETRFDAIALCCGAREPRDLAVPGRELGGIHFAMDYLCQQNRRDDGVVIPEDEAIVAAGKAVAVIGGGDTGSDCVGTAIRQGARLVTQLEILPRPPEQRQADNPWPEYSRILRESSSHKEGGKRLWSVNTKSLVGNDGHVRALRAVQVKWLSENGRFTMQEIPGSEFEVEADLVLLAMGFTGPGPNPIADSLGLERDARGNIRILSDGQTSRPRVFAAGDMVSGQSLVVRAIAGGLDMARRIKRFFDTP